MGTLSFSAAATGGVTVSPRLVLLVASITTACQVTGLGVGKPGIGNTCYNVFGNDTTTTCVNGGLPWKPDNASLPAANQTEAQCASDPCLNSECCKHISCEVGSKLHTECIADSNKKPPKKCFEGQCCGEDGKMDVSSTDCALCYPFIKCYPCFRSSKCSGAWYVPEILEYNCENIFTEPGLARLVTDGFLNVTLEDPPLTTEEIYRGKTATAIFSMTNESSKCSNSYYKLSCNDSVSDGIVTGAAFGSPVAIMCVPDPTDKTSVTPFVTYTFSVSVSRTQQTMTKYGVAAGTSSAAVEVRVMNSTSVPTVAIHPIPGKPLMCRVCGFHLRPNERHGMLDIAIVAFDATGIVFDIDLHVVNFSSIDFRFGCCGSS
eukprot:g4945.t1